MATINTSDLTQASAVSTSTDGKYTVTGTGVFDDLMEGVNAHLEAQFNLGRLTGAEYATVYLGAMQSSLQNSVQFILGKQQADKQAELLTKQVLTEEKNTLDVIAGTSLKDSQKAEVLAGTTRNNAKNTSDIAVNTSKISADTAQIALSVKQGTKSDAETAVLAQKEITEFAQTGQTTSTAPTDASILGKQRELYEEQAKGFKWNADQKYLDSLLRAWGMNVNTAGVPSTAVTAFGASGVLSINTIIEDGKPV